MPTRLQKMGKTQEASQKNLDAKRDTKTSDYARAEKMTNAFSC
jgi:hypothetical protein